MEVPKIIKINEIFCTLAILQHFVTIPLILRIYRENLINKDITDCKFGGGLAIQLQKGNKLRFSPILISFLDFSVFEDFPFSCFSSSGAILD